MKITLTFTDAALRNLEGRDIKEGNIIRIDANIIGGCGVLVSYKLIIDEPRRNDHVVELNGLKIMLDRFTMRSLGDETHIDYSEENGFIVGDSFSSGACSIETDI